VTQIYGTRRTTFERDQDQDRCLGQVVHGVLLQQCKVPRYLAIELKRCILQPL